MTLSSSYLNAAQVDRLLSPINPTRVLQVKKGGASLSYVAQHDIRAEMNRCFGFGRWSTDVLETALLFEDEKDNRWKCGYRATVKVTVCAPDGTVLAHYTDSHASGNMPQPDRAEAHALALTSAVSTAFKRACTNLGDSMGLSLYNKGQRTAFVRGTLVGSADPVEESEVKALGEEEDQTPDAPEQRPTMTPEAVAEALDGEVDVTATTLMEEQREAFLTALRIEAVEPDNGKRILAVAALKQRHTGTGVLAGTVIYKDGEVTLARLADLAAQGVFIKAALA